MQNNQIKILYKGKRYFLNEDSVEKLIQKDVLISEKQIMSFKVGDVFYNKVEDYFYVILRTHNNCYIIGGYNNSPFDLYSDKPRSYKQVIEFLNIGYLDGEGFEFICNINKDLSKLKKKLR